MEDPNQKRRQEIEEALREAEERDRLGRERDEQLQKQLEQATEALRAAGASPVEEERDIFGASLKSKKEKLKSPPGRLVSSRLKRTARNLALAGGLLATSGYLGKKASDWWENYDATKKAEQQRTRERKNREGKSGDSPVIKIANY